VGQRPRNAVTHSRPSSTQSLPRRGKAADSAKKRVKEH
jgi:hypothetical protein